MTSINMKYLFYSFLGIALPLIAKAADLPTDNHPLNPLGSDSVAGPDLYGRLIKFFLGLMGMAALFFMIFGGFTLLISRGNAEKIKQGKDTIMWAVVGIIVAFASYALLRFVIEVIITPANL